MIFAVILENPGIAFTHVASMLTEKWQSLPNEDKEYYEEIARETATTKKVLLNHYLNSPFDSREIFW